MSKIADLAKQGVYYRPLSDSTAQPEEKKDEQGNFSRGFKKAMLQVPQTLGGTAALVGDIAGVDGLKEYGLGVYQNNSDKIQAITKDSDSLSNVMEGDASAADWLGNTAGYVAGQAVQALATGGAGGFIGSQLAKRGISEVVKRGAGSLAAREVAGKVAAQGAKYGAGAAMLGNNLAQEAGSIYPEALNHAAAEGRELTGEDKARVVGSAVAAAGVDTAMDALMLGRVLKGARKPGESMLRAGVREVPGAMAREGITEGIQTGIERFGAGQELNTADAIRDYVDSIGVGVVGGGMGGAASVIRANKAVPEVGPLSRAANIATEQEVLQLENSPQPMISFPDGSVGSQQDFHAYLSQFEGEERQRKEREIMGRDPETGKRVEPPKEELAKSADTPEAESQSLAEWGAQHDPIPLEQAHALLSAPGTKGENLMVAPHPSGEGFTLVPAEWLTLDSQARHAELQKPAKEKANAVSPAAKDSNTGADRVALAEPGAAVATAEPGVSGAVPAVDAAPGAPALNEPEWKTNPYTAYKFAERARAEAFMANKGADPALFEVQEIDGKFAIKRRPEPTTTAGAPHADDAVLPQDDGAAGGPGSETADPAGSGESVASGAVAGQPGEVAAADAGAVATGESDPVRATGSADTDAALIEQAAHEAATSPTNNLPEPTQAQKEAGNYKVGRVKLHGLDISIENPAGSTRKGVSPDGKAWENQLAHHYGYIRRTEGADGDHVDAFIGPNPASDRVYIVDQVDPETGAWDEHKVLIGFDSEAEARAGYQANYEKGWQGAKAVSETSTEGFKAWLKDGDTTAPFAPQDKATPPTKLAAARAKHARQDEEVRKAAENIERRRAEREAAAKPKEEAADVPERQEIPEEAPLEAREESAPEASTGAASEQLDTGADIPLAFWKKVKVAHDVHVEETGAIETIEIPADQAIKSVREDIASLQALLKCMKGGK